MLAARLGITARVISTIETGRRIPSADLIERISEELDLQGVQREKLFELLVASNFQLKLPRETRGRELMHLNRLTRYLGGLSSNALDQMEATLREEVPMR